MPEPRSTSGGQPARISVHETGRLAALRRLDLLDSPKAASFDRVTRQAARALGAPIVLVSLVDENRQWFKSRVGIDTEQTSREVSFCAHAVYECRPLIVTDATLDARFAANPLVTGPPHIRAYAGVPLYTEDGYAIGTLCAIDVRPREFSDAEIDALRDFAYMIEDHVHARELIARMQRGVEIAVERENIFRQSFDRAPVGLLHADFAGRFLRANGYACRMLGRDSDELMTASIADLAHPDDAAAGAAMLLDLRLGRAENWRSAYRFLRRDGFVADLDLDVALKRTSTGEPEYLIVSLHDPASTPARPARR